MRKLLAIACLCALALPAALFAQTRPFCVPAECAPGVTCCTNDLLEVRFLDAAGALSGASVVGSTGSTLHIAIVIDTLSDGIQGWSYTVKHDMALLRIDAVSEKNPITNADADFLPHYSGGFKVLVKAFGGDDRRTTDAGVGQAVVLSFGEARVLPVANDQTIAFASYTVTTAPAEGASTKIEFADDELATAPGGPPVELNLTVAGETKRPTQIADAAVNGPAPVACDEYAFYFGGAASSDPVAAAGASLAISQRNIKGASAFELAAKNTGGTLTLVSGQVGDGADNLRELIITDSDGVSHTPLAGNTATITEDIAGVDRGAAIQPTGVEDFYFAQTNPLVGGPGFFVGFVADLTAAQTRVIPATPAQEPCPVNEILSIRFGVAATPFSRGDADGDGKINVTDAVLVVREIFGIGTPKFDCEALYDINNNGGVAIDDAIFLLNWTFRRGPRPDAPFLACGSEDAGDTTSLPCAVSNCP